MTVPGPLYRSMVSWSFARGDWSGDTLPRFVFSNVCFHPRVIIEGRVVTSMDGDIGQLKTYSKDEVLFWVQNRILGS